MQPRPEPAGGTMAKLTLVSHHLCPYVQRVAIALAEKAVPFGRVWIDLADKPDWFKAISPLGKVPLLRMAHSDRQETVLFDSSVICEYLEETQGGCRLHPTDPLQRAQHRAWMEFGSAILSDVWGLETARDPALYDAKRRAIAGKLATIDAVLGDGPFFAGARFSLVDAVFAPIFRYFEVFDAIRDTGVFAGLAKVQAWRAALAERPSVREAVTADYAERLRAFLVRHDAYLLQSVA